MIRFVEAVALGVIADKAFADVCQKLGLPPWHGCQAPVDYLTMPPDVFSASKMMQ